MKSIDVLPLQDLEEILKRSQSEFERRLKGEPTEIAKAHATDVDKTVKEYFKDVLAIVREFRDSADTPFDKEIDSFYENIGTTLKNLQVDEQVSIRYALLCYYEAVCLFIQRKYSKCLNKLITLKYLIKKLELSYFDSAVEVLFGYINRMKNNTQALIILSRGKEKDEDYDNKELMQIIEMKDRYENFNFKLIKAIEYNTIKDLLNETAMFDQIFFIGHGNNYHQISLKNDYQNITPEQILDFYLNVKKRPQLMAILSCSYEEYEPLADSKIFDYFILPANANTPNAEIFVKMFFETFSKTQNVPESFYLSQMALMCKNAAGQQVILYY